MTDALEDHEGNVSIGHKLQWYGHVSRSSGLAKTILQGTVKGVGRQLQGLDRPGVRQVPQGSGQQGKMEKTGCKIMW